jgi:hypothetical protein
MASWGVYSISLAPVLFTTASFIFWTASNETPSHSSLCTLFNFLGGTYLLCRKAIFRVGLRDQFHVCFCSYQSVYIAKFFWWETGMSFEALRSFHEVKKWECFSILLFPTVHAYALSASFFMWGWADLEWFLFLSNIVLSSPHACYALMMSLIRPHVPNFPFPTPNPANFRIFVQHGHSTWPCWLLLVLGMHGVGPLHVHHPHLLSWYVLKSWVLPLIMCVLSLIFIRLRDGVNGGFLVWVFVIDLIRVGEQKYVCSSAFCGNIVPFPCLYPSSFS